MATTADYYEVLGVGREASPDDIRKAYRQLAREYHPDVNRAPEAEARFKEVQEAYDVLKDENKRQIYDRYGHAGLRQGFDPGFGGANLGGLGDIFDAFFGTATRRESRGAVPGHDLQTTITIEFAEAVKGVSKEIELTRLEPCGECRGTGAGPDTKSSVCSVCHGAGQVRQAQRSVFGQFVNIATCENCRGTGTVTVNPCTRCAGSGRERRRRKRAVDIPAGIDDGNELRVQGEGEAGLRGGAPGDLYIQVRVRPDGRFQRDGADIHSVLEIDVVDAVLGGEYVVETVAGEEKVKLQAGTQPGSVVRLRGMGVAKLNRPGRGDHYVAVGVRVPENLSKREVQLFQELRTIADRTRRRKGFADRVHEALGK